MIQSTVLRIINSIKRRVNSPIRKNIVANLFGIGVNLLNQIILVPFYIIYWGKDLYSDWIVISALTAFFGMSDIGLNSLIQNRFSIKYSQGNIQECDSLLASNFVIVGIIGAICLLLGISYVSFFNITQQMGLSMLTRIEGSVIFIILICQIFIQMFSGIENAIYRATHNASVVVYYDQIAKLTIVIITFLCLLTEVPMPMMCLLICLPNLLLIFIKHFNARKYHHFVFSLKFVDLKLVRNIMPPAIAYMSFPLSNAILLQGFTLLVNRFWGSDTVVLYNTTRTMCNFIKTFLATILHSVWPEFSIAYGKKDVITMNRLFKKSIKASVILSVLISIGLLIFGPFIYKIWMHGTVEFNYGLMTAFLIVLVANTLWNTGCIALLATNKHVRFGVVDLFCTVLSFLFAYFFAAYFHSLNLVVYSMLVIDFPLALYVNYRFKLMLKEVSI